MLNISLSHIPGTVDACPLDGRMHLRFRARKGLLRAAKLIYQCNKNLWHIQRHTAAMDCAFLDRCKQSSQRRKRAASKAYPLHFTGIGLPVSGRLP